MKMNIPAKKQKKILEKILQIAKDEYKKRVNARKSA